MPKNTACLFACSEAFAFALYVTLKTFFAHSAQLADQADIFVYAYRWSDRTKKIISSCGPVKIVDYELPSNIPLTAQVLRFSPALYARFEAFNLLGRYENVICLDSDILVQKELKDVLEQVDEGVGLVKDTLPSVGKNFIHPIAGYDFLKPCYNAGFIVLKRNKLPVPGAEISRWLYTMLKEQSHNVELGDQGLINLALQHFNLVLHEISTLWNLPASNARRKLQKAYIIHSTGHRKFWSYYYFREWYSDYKCWYQAGGIPVSIRKNSPLWDKFLQKWNLNCFVFFQLAPDAVKYPIKFITFCIKFLFNIKY